MTLRRSIVSTRLATLIACSLIAVTAPFSAAAAPAGNSWYPIDSGFVHVDATTGVGTFGDGAARYQETVPLEESKEWVDPATADPAKTGPKETKQEVAPEATGEWVDPATTEPVPDPASVQTPDQTVGSVDPAVDEWVEPAPVEPDTSTSGVDPATGDWVDPNTTDSNVTSETVDPATGTGIEATPVETLVDPAASEGSIDPATGQWVEPAPTTAAVPDPAPLVEPGPVDAEVAPETEPWGQPIATAYIAGTGDAGATCHAAPEQGTETLAVLGEGEAVEVRAETVGEWQPVNCGGVGGYVHTTLISWTPMTAPEAVDDGERRERKAGKVNTGGGTTSGEEIVNFAMKYEGHPYVYAGEGPRAFDCSGFTMFVINNTVGVGVPHDMAVQYEMGTPVDRNALQLGDVVFFKNTFQRGMSHTGIYIGGGQFIHAENESTGVRISELDSDYYSSRWYGAVRFV